MLQDWGQNDEVIQPAQTAPAPARPQGVTIGAPITGPRQPTPERPKSALELEKQRLELEQARLNLKQDLTKDAEGKPKKIMPEAAANNLSSHVSIYGGLKNARGGFKDDYAGNWLTGDLENQLDERIEGMGTEGQRQWWASFRSLDNQIRNDLFGSALTPTEKQAYEGTTISPSMTPKTIRENLAAREKIIRAALKRRTAFYKANNYQPEAVDALVGEYAPDLADGVADPEAREGTDTPLSLQQDRKAAALAPEGFEAALNVDVASNNMDIDLSKLTASQQAEIMAAQKRGAPLSELKEMADKFARQEAPRLSSAQQGQIAEAIRTGDQGQAEALLLRFTGARPDSASVAKAIAHYRKYPDKGLVFSYAEADESVKDAAEREIYGDYLKPALEEREGAGIDAGVRGAAQTVTAGLASPAAAGLDALFSGGSYRESLQKQRAIDEADRRVNPGAQLTGNLLGAVLLPTRVGSVTNAARAEATAAGAATREVLAAGRSAGARQLGKEGFVYGGVRGVADNVENKDRFSSGAVSAGLGGALGYGIGRGLGGIANRWGRRGEDGVQPVGQETAQAAQDLDIAMPRFVAGGPMAQQAAAVVEKTPFGVGPIKRAATKMLDDSQAARDRIASEAGEVMEPAAMGDKAREGLKAWRNASGANTNRLYDAARAEIGDTAVAPTNTVQEVERLIREESQSLIETEGMGILKQLTARLENGEPITVEGARKTRTVLRDELSKTMTPSNADRITNRIMDAIASDVARDAPKAAAAFKIADRAYAERMGNIRDVLEPFVGKEGENWGADVAKRIMDNAKSNGERLDEVLKLMPREAAGAARATLISQLGRANSGAQDAAGEAFSLDTFLTNWDAIRGARDRIFTQDTVRSLNKLAKVAERAKEAGRSRNFSNTGNIIGYGATFSPLLSGTPTGLLASVGLGLAQYGGGKLLASPKFAQRLANMPETAEGAKRFWSGPWVAKLAKAEPAIAADITGLRDFMVRNLNGQAAKAAAEEKPKRTLKIEVVSENSAEEQQ